MRAPHHWLFRSSLVAALVAGCAPINVVVQDVTGFDARGASVGDVNAHANVNANTSVNANTAINANATANVGVPATGDGAASGPGTAVPAEAPTTAPTPAPTPRAYTGTVTTIPMSGHDLRYIFGINVDDAGSLYFVAGEQNVLYHRNPDGVLKAIATLGPSYITDMARDSKGNFFFTDWDSRTVRRVSPSGEISFLLGGNTTGTRGGIGAEANIGIPVSIAIDAHDQMVVGNTTSFYAVTPEGEATFINGDAREKAEVAYGYQDGWERVLFNEPLDVTIDARGVIYVADTKNNIIRKIDRANKSVSGLAGGLKGVVPGFADGVGVKAQFNTPSGVAVDKAGYVYVVDTENHRIRQIAPDGKVTTLAGASAGNRDGVGATAQFDGPAAIAIGADGTLYVADKQRLCKIE
jgi:sugar lactone lactonase YvrE